jgi:glutamine synthetase
MTHVFEYIWPDKTNCFLRSKVKVIPGFEWKSNNVSDLPIWNFDGSSTDQNLGKDTEVMLKPVRLYRDPFSTDTNTIRFLVLCQLDLVDDPNQVSELLQDEPVVGFNTRYWASQLAEKYQDQDCWFGLEQEYVFTEREERSVNGRTQYFDVPYKWSELSTEGQGDFYCSVSYPQAECNNIARKHLTLCLKAGVLICGLNAEVLPSQWEFQIGPGGIMEVGDDLLMARYILLRLAGDLGFGVSFHPKIISGEWNGSGCHINFSTKDMRDKNGDGEGLTLIQKAIGALQNDHPKILQRYGDGDGNELRLTGKHETSSSDVFNYGVGTRDTSIRIPNSVWKDGHGYLEDRRPASNIDPYLAMGGLMDVVLGPKVYTIDTLQSIGDKLSDL